MRKSLMLLAAGMLFLPISATSAQEEERPRRDGEMRERMIEEFDADGDGELNDEERQTARETMRERRGGGGRGQGRAGEGRGRGPEGRGPEGRGPEGRGPEGRGDRPAPPDPNALFDEFDADKDGQLSRDEFTKLTETRRGFMRGGRPPRDRGPRDSVSREGGDRPGPPPERRDGEFDRQPPLQNQVERPDGPPRGPGEGRRGPRGEGIGPPSGSGGPEGRGPEGRGPGPGGQRGPDANRLFDRFDADGDDQLSREEFTTLAERLQEMRERMGDAARRRGGGRGGEYGPPGRSGRPPRPQRPGEASEPESAPPAVDEDTT